MPGIWTKATKEFNSIRWKIKWWFAVNDVVLDPYPNVE